MALNGHRYKSPHRSMKGYIHMFTHGAGSANRLTNPGLLAVVVLLMTAPSASAQGDGDGRAKEAMAGFIGSWLYRGDVEQARSYFSKSPQAAQLAHDRVWAEEARDPGALPDLYWDFINEVWQAEAYQGTSPGERMVGVGDELIRTFERQYGVDVISSGEDVFLAFESSNAMLIYIIDTANEGAATVLRRSGRRTLGMLAAIATRRPAGPFLSFWQAEDDGRWRIQMAGAIRP